jgi:hypothetical protein
MNKNVLIGIAAFGGLLLVASMFGGDKEDAQDGAVVEAPANAIPADLPTNIPIYPDTTVVTVRDTDGDDARSVSLSLVADTTVEEVNAWYAAELAANGWGIKSDKTVAGYRIIQGENENLYTSMQAAGTEAPGKIMISQQIKVRVVETDGAAN